MLILIGTNHKYSPIEIREKFAFSKKRLREALSVSLDYEAVKGMVILSTCNRVELYASVTDTTIGIESLKRFLADYHRQDLGEINAHFYIRIGKDAALHLFNVSCGIDSQLIGETQVIEQIKFGYDEAKRVEATDSPLDRVFNQAVEAGVKVRNETKISEGDISLGGLSINFVKEKIGVLKDKKLLVIGTGRICELLARSLKKEEAKVVFIANRNIERAYALAKLINAKTARLDKLKEELNEADVIICAASSPHLILRKKDILDALNHQPLLMIDLGVPRNVDPEIKGIKGIELFHLDDLDFARDESLNRRKQEAHLVKNIIKEEIGRLCTEKPLESEAAEAISL